MSDRKYDLHYKYVGDKLSIFWTNPWSGITEEIASFWWPTHPPELTREVERIFENFAQEWCSTINDPR